MVSLNYLSTVLFQTAGVQLSPYQEYLADLRMEHPVITARYFTTAFGDKAGTAPSAFTNSIREYQWLQYSCVFDRAHRIPGFYSQESGRQYIWWPCDGTLQREWVFC